MSAQCQVSKILILENVCRGSWGHMKPKCQPPNVNSTSKSCKLQSTWTGNHTTAMWCKLLLTAIIYTRQVFYTSDTCNGLSMLWESYTAFLPQVKHKDCEMNSISKLIWLNCVKINKWSQIDCTHFCPFASNCFTVTLPPNLEQFPFPWQVVESLIPWRLKCLVGENWSIHIRLFKLSNCYFE